jgi:hypothetical protein
MKKQIILLPVIALLCIYCYACTSSKTVPVNQLQLRTGKYDFTMSDSLTNKTLVTGTLNIDASDEDVYGNYSITSVADSIFVGYGSIKRGGEFKGHYNKVLGQISMNMNPRIADANVYVSAEIKGKTLRGVWSYSTMSTTTGSTGGKFKADLQE